jgi:hypothetical protein
MSFYFVIQLLKSQPSIQPYQKVYIDFTTHALCIDTAYDYFGNIGRYFRNKTTRCQQTASRSSLVEFVYYMIMHIQSIQRAQQRVLEPLILSQKQKTNLYHECKRLHKSLHNLCITYQNDVKVCYKIHIFIQHLHIIKCQLR